MLEGLVTRAQRSVDTLVSKYVTRLAVAVPFLVALGFGTAAASVKLTEEYGSTGAHAILACAFVGVGLAAALAIAMSGAAPVTVSSANAASKADEAKTEVAGDTAGSLTPELLLTALGAVGPATLMPLIRLLVKNLPVVLLAIILGYVLFSERRPSEVAQGVDAG